MHVCMQLYMHGCKDAWMYAEEYPLLLSIVTRNFDSVEVAALEAE